MTLLENVCAVGRHCRTCRLKDRGRAWRASLVAAAGMGWAADFDCPQGKGWGEEGRLVAPTLNAPSALATCGPFWSAYRRVEAREGSELLKGYARQLAWIVRRRSCQQERMAAKLDWYERNVGSAA